MEPQRVEAYIRASCSVLDFDIGELWCAKRLPDKTLKLSFIQLYSSPAFEDFHSLLVQPAADGHDEETKHTVSPIICRGVCDGGQVVWANTGLSDGFTGKSEVPLNTAVGVPICSVDNDLYILVLFAVGSVPMTPNAVEYLVCLVRAVAMRTGCFLSASFTVPVTAPEAEDLQWDFGELARKYPNEVDLKLLPMKNVPRYFDFSEIQLFCELFHDYKLARKGNFTDKQLESLRDALKVPVRTAAAPNSPADSARAGTKAGASAGASLLFEDRMGDASASSSSGSVFSDAGWSSEPGGEAVEGQDAGVYCADDVAGPSALELQSLQAITTSLQTTSSPSTSLLASGLTGEGNAASGASASGFGSSGEEDHSPRNVLALLRRVNESSAVPNDSLLHIYAHMSYRLSQCRFHEFMIAMLGMTVFDSSELWLLSDRSSELHLMAAVYRTATMQKWTSSGISLRLQIGTDVPGKVMATERFCWDPRYCEESVLTAPSSSSATSATSSAPDFSRLRPARNGPRMSFAKELGLHTAFGVPVPGMRGPCGALVFYSTKGGTELDPLMVQLVENGVQIMADTSLKDAGDSADGQGNARVAAWLKAAERASSSAGGVAYVASASNKPAASSGETSAAAAPLDFEGRLQLCRSIVASKKGDTVDAGRWAAGLSSLVDVARIGAALNYSPVVASAARHSASSPGLGGSSGPLEGMGGEGSSSRTMPSPPISASSRSKGPSLSSFGALASAAGAMNEDIYSDAVVSAARALANFGNFQWSTFLEGSGLEAGGEGGPAVKLGSDKLLNMYGADWPGGSRKRKASAGGMPGGGGSGDGVVMFPVCLVVGCGYYAESAESQYCATHRGTRRCQKEGCGKCAQGATKYCIAHGGGRRCTYPGCFKGARDKLFCAAHGGGKRCTQDGCTKSAVGGSAYCTAHGGGKRCKFEGCNKSSQSSTDFCVKHGGGRSCVFKGCNKVARGKTEFCAAHGGGVRCKAKGCYKIAVGATSLCRLHGTAQLQAATAVTTTSSASSGTGTHNLNSLVSESEKLAREGRKGSSDSDDSSGDSDSDMDEAQVLYGRSK